MTFHMPSPDNQGLVYTRIQGNSSLKYRINKGLNVIKKVWLLLLLLPSFFAKAIQIDLELTQSGVVAIEYLYSNLDTALHVELASITTPDGETIAAPAITARPGSHLATSTTKCSGHNLNASSALFTLSALSRGCRVYLNPESDTLTPAPLKSGTILTFNFCTTNNITQRCDDESSDVETPAPQINITPLYDDLPDYKGRIYQVDYTLPNTLTKDEQPPQYATIMIRIDMDKDGDALWDDWETEGIDANGDGIIDFTLANADPYRTDIYVEIDAMDCPNNIPADEPCHRPLDEAMAKVTHAFDIAPIENPTDPATGTNQTGIKLHLEVDDIIPHRDTTIWNGAEGKSDNYTNCTDISNAANFICEKKIWFGTQVERENRHTLAAKAMAYHYSIWAHSYANGGGASGIAETPGNDVLITLGAERFGLNHYDTHHVGNAMEQAGTFMHELGHNLGLLHGGGDNINYKPNYLSVMNYRWQYTWIPNTIVGPRLDYSRQTLLTLDERALVEVAGVLGTGYDAITPEVKGDQTEWCAQPNPTGIPMGWQKAALIGLPKNCQQATPPGTLNHWLNWNLSFTSHDGKLIQTVECSLVSVDLNGGNDKYSWGKCNNSTKGGIEILHGWNDWATLTYTFQTTQAISRWL